MATRLHDRTRALSLALLLVMVAGVLPVSAQVPYVACWNEVVGDPNRGRTETITVCRLEDGDLEEYVGDTPPGPTNPALGTDANGECWYRTSYESPWMILSTWSDGSATLGIQINGFLALDSGRIPRCTSEPIPEEPPEELAWEAITEYIHDPPHPDLNPPIGRGLTGLETFAGVPVPGPWTETITIPAFILDVEVIVATLSIDWGDDSVDTYPPVAYERLVGYPEGIARHLYEVKTCDPPGQTARCHPTLSAYPITVSYQWEARWRVNNGPWTPIQVPPSTTTVDYPVIEAISVITEVGDP